MNEMSLPVNVEFLDSNEFFGTQYCINTNFFRTNKLSFIDHYEITTTAINVVIKSTAELNQLLNYLRENGTSLIKTF